MTSPTRNVTVLIFGPEAAAVGSSSVRVSLEEPGTCSKLRERLGEEIAALRPFLKTARLAVNSEFAGLDLTIREGDEVALIGMVSGG
jgi:molybdopterin converting factor small subunit